MSIEATSWALNVPVGGNEKVVLLGLANHAHPDGTETYPSLDTLARYAHCDKSTARRNLRKLVAGGWAIEDGVGPRGTQKFRLAMGVANRHPSQNGTGSNGAPGGVASAPETGGEMPPEPSFNRPEEPSVNGHHHQNGASGDWLGVPDEMKADALGLLKARTKVVGRVVTEREMQIAAAALAEFNRQGEAQFSVGAKTHFPAVVQRIRERPTWQASRFVHVVQSAWRLKWWERRGGHRRPDPRVIFSERSFERCVQDAINEVRARQEMEADLGLRDKVYAGNRTWDELTPREQANAREAVMMGARPWEEGRDAAPITPSGKTVTAATLLAGD